MKMEQDMPESVDEEYQKLIQLSFAKIVNCKQQRGGARLHKSLLVLHVLQKAKDEQRNKSYSESDITETLDEESSDDDNDDSNGDCFGDQRHHSADDPSGRPQSTPPIMTRNDFQTREEIVDMQSEDSDPPLDGLSKPVLPPDLTTATWRVLSEVNACHRECEYSYYGDAANYEPLLTSSSYNSSEWSPVANDDDHFNQNLFVFAFMDSAEPQIVEQMTSGHYGNENLPDFDLSGPGATFREHYREPPSTLTSTPLKRKFSFNSETDFYEHNGPDSPLASHPSECKRLCTTPVISQPDGQILKDPKALSPASSSPPRSDCLDNSQNMTELICVFNSSLRTATASPQSNNHQFLPIDPCPNDDIVASGVVVSSVDIGEKRCLSPSTHCQDSQADPTDRIGSGSPDLGICVRQRNFELVCRS